MANADRPRGLVPVGTLDGSPYCSNNKTFPVDSSNGTAIFVGDIIMAETDGNVAPASAGNTQIIGVCTGIKVDRAVAATEHPGYLPASTAGNVRVETGPNVIYQIQEDSDTSTLAATDRWANANHIAGAGSTTTGVSAHELDSDTSTSGAAGLRILQLVQRADNAIGANADWLVVINEHAFKTTSGV